MLDRLRSAYHGFWFAASERTARVRGPRPEIPAERLPRLPPATERRIEALCPRYGTAFESRLGARSALQNYEYLDWLDAATNAGLRSAATRRRGGTGRRAVAVAARALTPGRRAPDSAATSRPRLARCRHPKPLCETASRAVPSGAWFVGRAWPERREVLLAPTARRP